jgi:hypothetical protein
MKYKSVQKASPEEVANDYKLSILEIGKLQKEIKVEIRSKILKKFKRKKSNKSPVNRSDRIRYHSASVAQQKKWQCTVQ